MKLLCLRCDQAMDSVGDSGSDSQLAVGFVCPDCGKRVDLLANPAETQLATSIGYTVGGRKSPSGPMETVRRKLVGAREVGAAADQPVWTEAAKKRLSAAPNFVQGMIRALYNDFAIQRGYREVTPAVMTEAKETLGMEGM